MRAQCHVINEARWSLVTVALVSGVTSGSCCGCCCHLQVPGRRWRGQAAQAGGLRPRLRRGGEAGCHRARWRHHPSSAGKQRVLTFVAVESFCVTTSILVALSQHSFTCAFAAFLVPTKRNQRTTPTCPCARLLCPGARCPVHACFTLASRFLHACSALASRLLHACFTLASRLLHACFRWKAWRRWTWR